MNDQQLLRYSRHILLDEFDTDGQERLLNSHVLIVGMGGLGSPVAGYLASAGIGQLTVAISMMLMNRTCNAKSYIVIRVSE